MARRFDRSGYQRDMGKCTGVRKYPNGRIGRCDHPSHGCFTGDMRLVTPTGQVRIDSAVRGMPIFTSDPQVGIQESRVKKVLRHRATRTLEIHFEEIHRSLRVTAHHSLCTSDNRWLKAGKLTPGTILKANGKTLVVSAISEGDKVPVYNVIPYGSKTFFVEGVLVHSFTNFRSIREALHYASEKVIATAQHLADPTYRRQWFKFRFQPFWYGILGMP